MVQIGKIELLERRSLSKNSCSVLVTGAKGYPPPPTTKLAIVYHGGWQCETTAAATGYSIKEKFDLLEAQLRFKLKEYGVLHKFDELQFQQYGRAEEDPSCQMAATAMLRIVAQAGDKSTVAYLPRAISELAMQHFSGEYILPSIFSFDLSNFTRLLYRTSFRS